MNSGKVIVGILAGFAAGALVGVLFAPDKGSKTRKNIIGKGEDCLNGVKNKLDDFLEVITDKFEEIKKDSNHLVSEAKARFEESKKEMKDTAS